jgi:uncharacterized phosphosugar-binding protein
MYQFADVVIDIKSGKRRCHRSRLDGLTQFCIRFRNTSAIMHCRPSAATIEELLSRGITPPVFIGANVEGGTAHNAKLLKNIATEYYLCIGYILNGKALY